MYGRPRCLPSARARAMPALTRSTMIARSNSANTPEHLEQRSPGRRGGVDALLVQVEVTADRAQLAEERHQVLQRAAEPVDRPGHHHVDLAS